MPGKQGITRQAGARPGQPVFLDAGGCREAVRRMLSEGGPVRAVVSYWGEGAIGDLGVEEGADLTVVCDLRSGACNVQVVRELLKLLGPERVLTCDRLHAKAWIGQNWAIAGSSNASANGLGFEGSETRALLEANVVVSDGPTVAAMQAWADGQVAAVARTITEADFRAAARNRAGRRQGRPLPDAENLLGLLKASPEALSDRDAFVWLYEHATPDAWAVREMEAVRQDRNDDTIDFWIVEGNDKTPPGAHILDFNTAGGTVIFTGLWRVLMERHRHKDPDGNGVLLLCRKVTKFGHLPLGSVASWTRAAREAKESRRTEWPLVRFAKEFLK